MGFTVNPDDYEGGNRRPDMRAGRKILVLAGLSHGTSQAGNAKIDACWVCVYDPDGGVDVGALAFCNFTLTQSAAWKLQQVSRAVQQRSSWDAEDARESFDVLSRRPVSAEITVEPKWSGDGMRPEIGAFSAYSGELSDDMRKTAEDAQSWYRDWRSRKSGGSSQRRNSGGGQRQNTDQRPNYGEDDIPF